MRKVYFLLVIFFSFASRFGAYGQLANEYIYSSSTGATLDPMAGATTIVPASVDDQPSTIQNIGFTFTYEGVPYTQFSASPDGFIKLGAPAAVSQFTNAITSTTNIPKLFPYWDDLATGVGGSVSFVVTGSAPNRILVVQWFVTNPRNTGGAANSTMQAWLYETSGRIDFRYGAGVGPSSSASIGIGGAVATNFISITTPSNASSTSTANNSTTVWPGNGTMYMFLPPPPCVPGSLGGGTAQGPAGTACPGASFTLTVTGASFGTGLTYQWETSPDGSTWSNAGGASTSQTYTTSVTTNTYFRRKMTCSGTDAWSTSVLVSVSAPVTTFPYLSSFGATLPACWFASEQTAGATQHWAITATDGTHGVNAPQSGTNFAYLYVFLASTTYNPYYLTTTAISLPATPMQLKYFYYIGTGGYHGTSGATGADPYPLTVQISTNGGTTWTDLYSHSNANTTFATSNNVSNWALKTIDLTAYSNQTVLVRFKSMSNFGGGFCDQALDEVLFEAIPPCVEPSGLTVTSLTATSAALSWTASPSNPASGYEWEVRTSGAPGSGGATAAGTTTAGVTTATTGNLLAANTTYTYYVRSNCGGSFSPWSVGFTFTTPCLPITTPFTETFSTYATTFPPTCWTRNDITYLTGNAATASAGGGSAKFDFFSASSGTTLDLTTATFNAVPVGYRLTFDHAYATFLGEVDQLQVFYSTDGGATYSSLVTLLGGASGPLNTGGSVLAVFSPASSQWANKAYDLPVGTNRLRFRGVSAFGNNLYLDNITVEPTPSCLPVTNVTAVGVSPTSVIVSFTPPATTPTVGYVVEYGAPGFTPGTTNTAGPGGTVTFGPGSPVAVTGLTANTTYDFYVRKIRIAGVDFSANRKVTASTLCNATNIPYLQNFESSVVPAAPTCTSVEDVNGNSGSVPNSGGGSWFTYDGGTNAQTYVSPTKTIRYLYDATNSTRPADDWFYTQGLNLTGGTNYRLKFFIKASDGPTWTERLEVKYGTLAQSSAMTNLLYTNNNIATALASPWDSVIVDFSPATSGVYYIGFHAISLADQAFLYLDDVSVKLAPLVDVGVSGITVPSLNCPTNNVFVQATVTNYNTTVQNFATYPVTVTANITGAATGTLTATLNSGTLAPGASMNVYLSPSFNFSAGGIYNITVATSTTPASNDPETGNDSYTTAITVNPNPPAPLITPANPAVCAGNPVQLSTQFTASPPPVTLPAVTSGAITVAIPDNTPAGISHTLNVASVPAGANIVGISVTVNVTHTWIGDVIINLKAPNNNVLNLINQRGGSGDNLTNTVFTSTSGAPSLATGTAPFTGTFAPDAIAANPPTAFPQNVTSFNGLMSQGNGNWTIALRDNAGLDVGTLTSWSITLTYQILTPVITWTPATGLYTNAGATTAYTGGNAFSLYANPAATTTYTVTATTASGCTSSASTTVTVNPFPVVTLGTIPDTVCISDPVIALTATPVGGTWTGIGVSGNNFIPPSTAVGTYTLTYSYTSPAGCTTTATKKIAVKECPERMILLRDNALFLYPNPNTGHFNIKINSVLYNNLIMKVYTNTGTLVRTQQLGGLAWGRVIPIDMSNLPGGVYMVKFYYDGGARTSEKTFKVIIATP